MGVPPRANNPDNISAYCACDNAFSLVSRPAAVRLQKYISVKYTVYEILITKMFYLRKEAKLVLIFF